MCSGYARSCCDQQNAYKSPELDSEIRSVPPSSTTPQPLPRSIDQELARKKMPMENDFDLSTGLDFSDWNQSDPAVGPATGKVSPESTAL